MSDIVERLRRDADATTNGSRDVVAAAADEIERLREALKKITHEHLQFAGYFEDSDHAAQMQARAALAKETQT
jgi:hypothetical protein